MNPKVSIIIPCFRQGQYLASAVNSALAQSYTNLEVVVINDGSDDDTEAVASQFKNKIVYVGKPNGGTSSARNAGIKAASGKYVLFLDADDLLHLDAVSWLVDAVRDGDDALSVMGWTDFTKTPGDRPHAEKLPSPSTPLGQQLLTGDIPPVHAYLVARQAVHTNGGFDETLPSCEDWDLWLRLVVFGGLKTTAVGRVGAYYRRYPGSKSTNFIQMDMAGYTILMRCLEKLQGPGRPDWLSGQAYRHTMRVLRKDVAIVATDTADELRQQRRYRESVRWLGRSFRDGQMSLRGVSGALKLLPHWALKRKQEK